MTTRHPAWIVVAAVMWCLALALRAVSAELPVVSGSVYVYQAGGSRPAAAVGHRVYLYNKATGWIGPSVTDNYGRFAFYHVSPNKYLLRIYYRDTKTQPFQAQITVPPALVRSIVLPHN
jgi:hypothetical protein